MRKKAWFYIKSRVRYFLLYLLMLGIFWLVLFLYNVPRTALWYGTALSGALMAFGAALDFLSCCRHEKNTREFLKDLPHELNVFPPSREPGEWLYKESLGSLFSYKEKLEKEAGTGRQEMLDYYSLWAHQIKTPLSAMDLLLQSFEAETKEDFLAFARLMKMELFKTEQYVDMVLSYLRMEGMSGDLCLKRQPLDDIVRQAVKKYSQLFILKKIGLNYQKSDELVLTDKKWLLLAVEQLLSNALKYTNKGTISIYMDPEKKGVLVIEDEGIGIQAEDLPRVFEKGFTGYNGRKDKKSTGIGLYLCKSICDKLNHGLQIESPEGRGTKVSLNLYREPFRVE